MSACGGDSIFLPGDLPPPVVPRGKQPRMVASDWPLLTTRDAVVIELQFDCPKQPGNFPDPETPCSSLFVICDAGGVSSTGVCPAGTVYDTGVDRCSRPR